MINEESGERATVLVAINEVDLLAQRGLRISAPLADINDSAVAIQVADRWAQRNRDYPCHIRVKLPVRQPEVLSAERVQAHLTRMLHWFTGDDWTFEFMPISEAQRLSEMHGTRREFPSNAGIEGGSCIVERWSGHASPGCAVAYAIMRRSASC